MSARSDTWSPALTQKLPRNVTSRQTKRGISFVGPTLTAAEKNHWASCVRKVRNLNRNLVRLERILSF
jgi:hypothetical protein